MSRISPVLILILAFLIAILTLDNVYNLFCKDFENLKQKTEKLKQEVNELNIATKKLGFKMDKLEKSLTVEKN